MDERFIPLAAYVRGLAVVACTGRESEAPAEAVVAPPPSSDTPLDAGEFAHADVLGELALVRLAAHEAFERGIASLLASFAERVLGRELALAPAELEALAGQAWDASRELEPLTLALSAVDAERVRTPLPTRIDPSLAAGDFVVELREGALESPLRFRLQAALARAQLADV